MNRFLIVLALLVACAFANRCGGNCPSNDCTDCPCGTSINHLDISSYCRLHSDWSQSCCQCIASHESGGNGNAVNHNTNGSDDVGLFQINNINWGSCSGGGAPCNPSTNTACAHLVWQWGGGTWKLWSTCGACGCCGRA